MLYQGPQCANCQDGNLGAWRKQGPMLTEVEIPELP